ATRDRYRRAVETIAKGSVADEGDIARRAVELARTGLERGPAQGHVGYYLVGPGQAELKGEFRYRPRWRERLLELVLGHPRAHYLANPDSQLRFALLTDFADAPEEHRPEDEDYLRAALAGVKALNDRYAGGGPDKFFLFHRRRVWNPVQGCWMGWERKRGKLSEFNRLLRGDQGTSYSVVSGDLESLPPIRFVITLDADTQ